MRDWARALRLKYREKGDHKLADNYAGQELALNRVLGLIEKENKNLAIRLEKQGSRIQALEEWMKKHIPSDIEKEWFKWNFLALAQEHKQRCKGHCNISLISLMVALDYLGVGLTKKERMIFC